MTDPHVRILAMVARHTQRRLDEYDEIEGTPSAASVKRRQVLKTRAMRTRARVAAAHATRRRAPKT
jgi:hypothetical protein